MGLSQKKEKKIGQGSVGGPRGFQGWGTLGAGSGEERRDVNAGPGEAPVGKHLSR